MKIYTKIEFIKKYDGEYFHHTAMFGIEYSQATFSEDDKYKQLKFGFGIFNLVIGYKK